MAVEDLLPVLQIAPDLLRSLPEIVQVVQIITYFFFVLFLGSIAMKGYRGYANLIIATGARIGLGFAALLAGVTLSGVIPFLNEGLYKTFQINMIVFGVISSVILLVFVRMITFNIFDIQGMKNKIKYLQEKLSKVQNINGKKLHPISIAGIALLAGFIAFSFIFFQGFPNIIKDMGLNPEDLNSMADEIEDLVAATNNLPPGCVSLITLARELGADGLTTTPHQDAQVQALMESGSGSVVQDLYLVRYGNKDIFVGVTMKDQICSVTQGQFCECLNI